MMKVNGAPSLADRIFWRHHDELREMWQGKLLLAAKGQIAAVVLSVLSHSYPPEAFITLMKVCFPGFVNLTPPFYSSAGRIWYDGRVVAELMQADGTKLRWAEVFKDKTAMETAWRRLCDEARLSDADREQAFAVLLKWVVADYRLDPNRTVEVA